MSNGDLTPGTPAPTTDDTMGALEALATNLQRSAEELRKIVAAEREKRERRTCG
jgi:hypothetical protein